MASPGTSEPANEKKPEKLESGDAHKPKSNTEEEKAIPNVQAIVTSLVACGIAVAVGILGDVWRELIISFGINYAVFLVVAWPTRSERYYDFTGMITFIAVDFYSFFARQSTYGHPRSIILSLMLLIWTLRLGSFLFRRMLQHSEDKRFAAIRVRFFPFLMLWTFQGLWALLISLPVLIVNSSSRKDKLYPSDYVGWIVWVFGFIFEIIADNQKQAFIGNRENRNKFINVGLWKISRHPNYFGEITIWVGMVISAGSIAKGWDWLIVLSPIYTAILLIFISGIPVTEKRADEKFAGNAEYEEYKKHTPVLIPFFYCWH